MYDSPREKPRGIWPPILIENRTDGRVDLDRITEATRYFAAAGVHGVYTADTASEFYTMEFEEWDELAGHFRQVAAACGKRAGIGCTWTNQAGILRRVARARELHYDNIHLSQPYWFRLNEAAQETYWRAVGEAAEGLPIIVYAGSQGQLPIDGPLLGRLREHCPSIVGTKSPGFDGVATSSLLVHCPEMAHFVNDQVGAAGAFSTLVLLCPPLALHWFKLMEEDRWTEAFEIQRRVARFYEQGVGPIRRAGYAIDKAVAHLGRVPGATRGQRPPYRPVPVELYARMEAAARSHLPEFCAARQARGLPLNDTP
ncbi:MAG: dihydrodipicolinate synthase family protein [Verrucomicrobia bacterium]|nr:dihydrodipicolinate synthase family protein [Verrucomicrobiota bacterium]